MQRSSFAWPNLEVFKRDPFAVWVELKLGINMSDLSKPSRAVPSTLSDAARQLEIDAGVEFSLTHKLMQDFLVAAHEVRTPEGRAPFAFKLHQFVSGAGKVMTTLEAEGVEHITLDPQRFAPGRKDEGVLLYAAHFCRDCGAGVHPVWRGKDGHFEPREIDDVAVDVAEGDKATFGFLAPKRQGQSYQGNLDELPENWFDVNRGEPRLERLHTVMQFRNICRSTPKGTPAQGEPYWFIPGKFRFCLNCGFVHEAFTGRT